jgi:hypothetical protein
MINRSNAATVVLVAGLAFLMEALALHSSSGIVKYGLVGLIVFACLLTIVKVDLYKFGVACAYSTAFFTSWNGFRLGGLIVGDAFMLLAMGCLVFANLGGTFPKIPGWVIQLAFGIILVAILHQLLPTDPLYLMNRVNLTAAGQPALPPHGILLTNLGIGLKFVIGILFIPTIFAIPAMRDRRIIGRFAFAFALGASVSAVVAFSDRLGITRLGHVLTHLPAISGARQPGFSLHPNFLAAGCVLALPIAIWMVVSANRSGRLVGAALLLALVLGVYASGSRGGTAALGVTIVVSIAVLPRARPYLPQFLLALIVAALALSTVFPAIGHKILVTTRLSGDTSSTAGSDIVRAAVGAQGVRDFYHSPFDGIGLQVATQASNVYLQLAATGGLILITSMAIYLAGAALAARRLFAYSTLAAPLLTTIVAVLVLNYFEADLTDRFYYVPEALIVALACAADQGLSGLGSPGLLAPIRERVAAGRGGHTATAGASVSIGLAAPASAPTAPPAAAGPSTGPQMPGLRAQRWLPD